MLLSSCSYKVQTKTIVLKDNNNMPYEKVVKVANSVPINNKKPIIYTSIDNNPKLELIQFKENILINKPIKTPKKRLLGIKITPMNTVAAVLALLLFIINLLLCGLLILLVETDDTSNTLAKIMVPLMFVPMLILELYSIILGIKLKKYEDKKLRKIY